MSGQPIGSYGFLSDCNSAALVGRDGSIDWLCMPRFDRPSVFGRLLDRDAGYCQLAPTSTSSVNRRYVPGSLVLETTFETPTGVVMITDALAFKKGQRGHDLGLDAPHKLLRWATCTEGKVEMCFEIAPRPEYGLGRPFLKLTDGGLVTVGGPNRLTIGSPVQLALTDSAAAAVFEMEEGGEIGFSMRWGLLDQPVAPPTPPEEVGALIDDVVAGWRSWEEEHDIYEGPNHDLIKFSSRVLKGLTYRPTGAIVAAPTTSLPEVVGGQRNWDYRYSWIRDASLTLEALWVGTCSDEVHNFVDWMMGAAGGHVHTDKPLQIMYGIGGERDLFERELSHLRGWRDSAPVRIGNGAAEQTQLDIYGEFLNAFCLYAEKLGDIDEVLGHFIIDMADAAARHWMDTDAGMWEMRAEPRHHVSSKIMCWVALDRALKLAPAIDSGDRVEVWERERDSIREAILTQGFSDKKQAFAQSFGSDELDASALLIPLVGFLDAHDPRMLSTIDAIAEELTRNGMVIRYRGDDGLEGEEGTFMICSFWMVSCLALAGRVDGAEELFESVVASANDLGLLAEEFDPRSGELLGNYPQAFSHVGLIMAAYHLDQARTAP